MENDSKLKLLTKNEVLKTFKEEGSYLSDPEDYEEGMIIDETPKAIRDSILNENNNDVENALEDLKKLDEFEDNIYKTPRQEKVKKDLENLKSTLNKLSNECKEKEEENLIKALAEVYEPEDYTSKKEHARIFKLDYYIKGMSEIFHTIYRDAFVKYPKIELMKRYVERYKSYYSDIRQLMDFYECKLKNGCTQEELNLLKKSIEDVLDKHNNDVKILFNKFYEKMEEMKNG